MAQRLQSTYMLNDIKLQRVLFHLAAWRSLFLKTMEEFSRILLLTVLCCVFSYCLHFNRKNHSSVSLVSFNIIFRQVFLIFLFILGWNLKIQKQKNYYLVSPAEFNVRLNKPRIIVSDVNTLCISFRMTFH